MRKNRNTNFVLFDLPDPDSEPHWFHKESEVILKSVKTIDVRARDEFQSNHTAKEIKAIEEKFLNFKLRTRDDHPAKTLTIEERQIYAAYLESKGDVKGAQSFLNYSEETEKNK